MNEHRHVGEPVVPARARRARWLWPLLAGVAIAFWWALRRRRAPDPIDLPGTRRPDAGPPSDEPPMAGAPASGGPGERADEAPPGTADAEVEELSLADAARILGCGTDELPAMLDGAPATRARVEQLALVHYRWRRHVDDPDSYWVTLKQAAVILGVSPQRVKQLLESGEVPYVVHRDGVRLMRREELLS